MLVYATDPPVNVFDVEALILMVPVPEKVTFDPVVDHEPADEFHTADPEPKLRVLVKLPEVVNPPDPVTLYPFRLNVPESNSKLDPE